MENYPLLSEEIKLGRTKSQAIDTSHKEIHIDDHSQASVSLLTNKSFRTFTSLESRRKKVRFS